MRWKFRYYAMRTFGVALMFLCGGVAIADRSITAGFGFLGGVTLYCTTEIMAAIRGYD